MLNFARRGVQVIDSRRLSDLRLLSALISFPLHRGKFESVDITVAGVSVFFVYCIFLFLIICLHQVTLLPMNEITRNIATKGLKSASPLAFTVQTFTIQYLWKKQCHTLSITAKSLV